jgi:uncharacterized membrane protein
MNRRPRGDDGQLMLLVIGYFAIAALALTVVVNASKLFLAQRALVSAADGAAQVAAQAVDEASIYRGVVSSDLPLHSVHASNAVLAYAQSHRLAERFPDLQITQAAVQGQTVAVTLRTKVSLPFLGVLVGERRAGVVLSATAKARMPFRP